ncbi:MAG: DinB family protein [Chitinophagaceae bacterium]
MKKIIAQAAICLPLLFCICTKVNAQALTSEDIKAQLVKDWERAKAYTIDYLNAMPANKYTFKATDSVRSFAQQMLHLAGGNVGLMMAGTDQKPTFNMARDAEKSATAWSKDSVMYYVTNSYDYCISAVKATDVNKWGEKKKFGPGEETRFSLITKTFEHQTHHRGQTTIYIRLVGVRPPNERLF